MAFRIVLLFVLITSVACQPVAGPPTKAGCTDAAKFALVQGYIDAHNAGDGEAMGQLFTEEFVWKLDSAPFWDYSTNRYKIVVDTETSDLSAVARMIRLLAGGNTLIVVENMSVEDETVVASGTVTSVYFSHLPPAPLKNELIFTIDDEACRIRELYQSLPEENAEKLTQDRLKSN